MRRTGLLLCCSVLSLALVAAVVVVAQTPVTKTSILGYMQRDPGTDMLNGSLPLQPFCYISRRKPFAPKAVPEFCDAYAQQSCCLPFHDSDMQGMWAQFLGTGKTCSKTAQQPPEIYQALKEFWCIACDPNQYKYISLSPTVPEDPNAPTTYTITMSICRSFVDRLWPVTDPTTGNSNVYDECGFSYPTACATGTINGTQYTFQAGGYFACGNDFIIPSVDVKDAMTFMNGQGSGEGPNPTWGFRSPEIDNSNIFFVIVNDTENCFNGFAASSAENTSSASALTISVLLLLLSVLVALFNERQLL